MRVALRQQLQFIPLPWQDTKKAQNSGDGTAAIAPHTPSTSPGSDSADELPSPPEFDELQTSTAKALLAQVQAMQIEMRALRGELSEVKEERDEMRGELRKVKEERDKMRQQIGHLQQNSAKTQKAKRGPGGCEVRTDFVDDMLKAMNSSRAVYSSY